MFSNMKARHNAKQPKPKFAAKPLEENVSLTDLANSARSRRDWATDALLRRKICSASPKDAGSWLQLGHALKELGFHKRAEGAYQRALTLEPNSAEITLQLAHLKKIMDDPTSATTLFQTALDLGYPDRDHVQFELKLISEYLIPQRARVISSLQNGEVKLFLSAPTPRPRESDTSNVTAHLGKSDYSYSFAMKCFTDALDLIDFDYSVISHPEYIADIRSRFGAGPIIHLGFYPPERMRILKFAYNINCFAWEFDRLRTAQESLDFHAFSDQAKMLAIPDEIWMPSTHGVQVIQNYENLKVKRMPAPFIAEKSRRARAGFPNLRQVERSARDLDRIKWEPLAILPRVQHTLDDLLRSKAQALSEILAGINTIVPKIFISVFNVHDYRKQIEPMLRGFIRFCETNDDAVLLLKMTTPHREKRIANRILMEEQINRADKMIAPLISDRIWITDDVLTRDEMNSFYDFASFYACTSYAEGQNLPLIEAISRGVVPVSVAHTAMSDYINENNSVVIDSNSQLMDARLSARYRLFGVETNYVEAESVEAALLEAASLSLDEYILKMTRCQLDVDKAFGIEQFTVEFNELISRIGLRASA